MDVPLSSKLSQRLRLAREKRGISRRDLAARLGGDKYSTLSKIEEGDSMPGIDTVELLARALGVSAGWLAYGEGIAPAWEDEKKAEPTV
ncbi:MAG TPA: helix-turn-helix transcriptional regulator [Pseudomonadota bacterium]|nr:helix-turn-helix transcriptional regulator [Pseudomonadota bacterium]